MIIGISGKIGSGKDLTGKIVQILTCQPTALDNIKNLDELKAVKDRDGITIRVNRPQLIERDFEHESETSLDNAEFDYVVTNNGTIEELIIKIKEILIKENLI